MPTQNMFLIWSCPNLSNLLTMMVKLTGLSLCQLMNSSSWSQHLKWVLLRQKLFWIFSFEKDTLILKLVGIQFHQILLQIIYIHIYRFLISTEPELALLIEMLHAPLHQIYKKLNRKFENLVKLTLHFSNVCG